MLLYQDLYLLDIPSRAIDKADLLKPGVACSILTEVAADGDAVCAALEKQDQIIAIAAEDDVLCANAGTELNGIDLVGAAVIVLNGVLAPAAVEAVYIVAGFAIQVVIAETADEGIVASATVERVVALITLKEVIAGIAVE